MTPLSRGIISSGKLGGIAPITADYNTLDLVAANKYMQLVNSTANGELAYMMACWIYPTTGNTTGVIYVENTSGNNEARVLMRISSTSDEALLIGGRDTTPSGFLGAETGDVLTLNTWQHIIGIIDAANDTILCYVDGVQVMSTSVSYNMDIDGSSQIVAPRIGTYLDDSQDLSANLSLFCTMAEVPSAGDIVELAVARQFTDYSAPLQAKFTIAVPMNEGVAAPNKDLVSLATFTLAGGAGYGTPKLEFAL